METKVAIGQEAWEKTALSYRPEWRTLTLTETGQRYQTSNAYDSSDGRLVETVQQQQIGPATIVTRLRIDSSN